MADTISYDEWKKLDIRVGEIIEAQEHPNADKLLVLKINIGTETRQVVAGIKAHYDPDDLVGMKVIFFANLEPAELRGIKSEGMVLAAVKGSAVVLLQPEQEIDVGAKVQ